MRKKRLDCENFIQLENAEALRVEGGGGPDHELKFCVTVELKECITKEGKYCGTSYVEVTGPHNPW